MHSSILASFSPFCLLVFQCQLGAQDPCKSLAPLSSFQPACAPSMHPCTLASMFRGIVPSGIPSLVPSFSPDYPPCLFTKALPMATLPLPTRLLPTRVLMPPKRKTLPPPMSGASTSPFFKVTCSFLCLPSFYPCMHPEVS